MRFGPRTRTSPVFPGATSRPRSSVIRSSTPRAGRPTFENRWIQRFDAQGRPRGEPVDVLALALELIEDQPGRINWEGMDWLDDAHTTLVLVTDSPWRRGAPFGAPRSRVVFIGGPPAPSARAPRGIPYWDSQRTPRAETSGDRPDSVFEMNVSRTW